MSINTDWNLVVQAQISFSWISKCLEFQKSNKTIKELIDEYRDENENCNLINPGLLIAYAYISFVYPRETALQKINNNNLNFSKFNVKQGNKNIIRRLRNSLAHGKFSIDSKAIISA